MCHEPYVTMMVRDSPLAESSAGRDEYWSARFVNLTTSIKICQTNTSCLFFFLLTSSAQADLKPGCGIITFSVRLVAFLCDLAAKPFQLEHETPPCLRLDRL